MLFATISWSGTRTSCVLDAFRYDFLERYADQLPHLVSMREGGASLEGRVNVLPTATAVSHTNLSTATDPRIHGITGNRVYDPGSGRRVDPFDDAT
jgi:predicted AlkP superfamily pyrophosphatase or phosphodiesterase